ncbi:MAG: hypothetical protein AAF620_00025 [Bacteroidota bacterium]
MRLYSSIHLSRSFCSSSRLFLNGEDVVAGAVVDITVATGGAGGVLIAAAAAGGALGSAAGDVTGQVTENLIDGQSVGDAVTNVSFENTGKKAWSAMSKNITTTATTLNKMGASASTTQGAVDNITKGMGEVGKNTVNNVAKASAAATVVTEGAVKTTEIVQSELDKQQ